jgi:hypothetical protein
VEGDQLRHVVTQLVVEAEYSATNIAPQRIMRPIYE